ncbi:hypothetical protein HY612_01665 [Candidatus Roizmanbacteria bacterium]|nr:hypothetical protein [Candidatus Roizmanbacteria bacterium]
MADRYLISMKKYFQITKIGNSLFATLSSKLVEQLNLRPGDQVFYEIIPGKKKIIMNIVQSSDSIDRKKIIEELNEKDKEWIKKHAGSLSSK